MVEGHERGPADPRGLAPPLLPGAAGGLGPEQGDGPLHVGAAPRQGGGQGRLSPPDPRDGQEGHGRARRHGAEHAPAGTWRPRSATSSRSTTRPGRTTGRSCRSTRPRPAGTRRTCARSWTRRWTWIAERDGEVLGAALTLPDVNVALAHMNGRLLPFGWAKFLWYRRKIQGCRVLALGVKPEYQDLGIAAALYIEHLDHADPERKKIWWGEMGWILETNEAMNRAMEGMGGKIVRRYRIFDKELAAASRRRRGQGLGDGRGPGGVTAGTAGPAALPLDSALDVRRQSQRGAEERACPGRAAGDGARAAPQAAARVAAAARSGRRAPAGSRPAPWCLRSRA